MRSRTQNLVENFHEVFGHPISKPISVNLANLRAHLIIEESTELTQELWQCAQEGRITPNLLKEMGDLQYVLDGLAVSLGIDLDACTTRVHESNMSKLGADGKPIYRADGKVLKGPNYKEPDMTDLVPLRRFNSAGYGAIR